jgi:hypothetical protein
MRQGWKPDGGDASGSVHDSPAPVGETPCTCYNGDRKGLTNACEAAMRASNLPFWLCIKFRRAFRRQHVYLVTDGARKVNCWPDDSRELKGFKRAIRRNDRSAARMSIAIRRAGARMMRTRLPIGERPNPNGIDQ